MIEQTAERAARATSLSSNIWAMALTCIATSPFRPNIAARTCNSSSFSLSTFAKPNEVSITARE